MAENHLLKSLQLLVHPYVFILKEGDDIESNPLDYSLLMLKLGTTERLQSPNQQNAHFNDIPIRRGGVYLKSQQMDTPPVNT